MTAARQTRDPRLARRAAVEPPVPYPERSLTYLANIANSRAAAFYARHGFVVEGEEYLEAGIAHVGMRARL